MSPSVSRKLSSHAFILSLCALFALLIVNLFRWTLVEYLTPFIEPPLEIGIGVFFLVSLGWSVVHLIRERHAGMTNAFTPLAVNVATALIVMLVPFTELTTNFNFRLHLNGRTAVVEDVLTGKYENRVQVAGGRGDLIALPPQLSGLSSSGGEIIRFRRQNDTLILFFDYRGILDSFSGFVYSTDDLPPQSGDFGGKFFAIERLREHWFWVSSRN
jgi:hypothetical protein